MIFLYDANQVAKQSYLGHSRYPNQNNQHKDGTDDPWWIALLQYLREKDTPGTQVTLNIFLYEPHIYSDDYCFALGKEYVNGKWLWTVYYLFFFFNLRRAVN